MWLSAAVGVAGGREDGYGLADGRNRQGAVPAASPLRECRLIASGGGPGDGALDEGDGVPGALDLEDEPGVALIA